MYTVYEGTRTINDVMLRTFIRNVKRGITDLDVEAGTTGFKGDVPREKSARAYVAIRCNRGDFLFVPIRNNDGRIVGFEVGCCSDGALRSLADSLGFAKKALTDKNE